MSEAAARKRSAAKDGMGKDHLEGVPPPTALKLLRAANLRTNFPQISKSAFERRKDWWIENAKEGKFLAEPEKRGQGKPNPMTDPAMMEGMMGGEIVGDHTASTAVTSGT